MNTISETYKPEGFHTVHPCLFADDPLKLIDFLKNAFYAREVNRSLTSDGNIANVIMQIGDSCIMISQARAGFTGMRTSLCIYVDDVG